MTYLILPSNLHTIADLTKRYLTNNLGLTKIRIEESIEDSIEYRPTFYSQTTDFYVLCVDVSEKIYNPTRWNFVTDCEKSGRPIKLYVSIPDTHYSDFDSDLKKAKKNGIGVLEVNANCQTVIQQPLALSLTGLRSFDKTQFPHKYRQAIVNAEETFKNGDPNKACSSIYDEIEALTRKIAIKSYNSGKWKTTLQDPSILEERMAWAKLIEHLRDNINRLQPSPYACLKDALISSIHGLTPLRNQSSHKAKSKKKLQTRDLQLRTRMESAIDILQELIKATNKLHI